MDNKNELDDLIVYAPEENEENSSKDTEDVMPEEDITPQNDLQEQEEYVAEDTDSYDNCEDEDSDEYENESDDEFDFEVDNEYDTEYDDESDEEYERAPKKSHKWMIIVFVIAIILVLTVMFLQKTAFMQNYTENFTRNIQKLLPALFVEEVREEEDEEETVVVEDEGGNAIVYKEYKETIATNDEETNTKYVYGAKESYMIPYEGISEACIVDYQNGIVCGRVNSLSYINSSGEVEWEKQTSIASPIVKSEGKYIAVAENGGKRISLYLGSELLFDIECPYNIKSCNVSSNGDVVLVVEKDGYKGGVSVYNKRGKEVFVWSSGQNDVICADISSASRRVSVGLLNTDETVYSIIQIFDITKSEAGAAVRFDDTIIFDVDYSADTITGYGDNSMICMTSTGRVIIDRRYDTVELACKKNDSQGNKALLFDSDNIPIIQTYNRKGRINAEVVIEELADCIDIEGDYFIYNSGRDVMLRKGNKNRVNVYTATMDITSLHIIDSNTFVIVHSNSLEIVKI